MYYKGENPEKQTKQTSKKNKKWILKAVDRLTQKTIAWVIGKRNVQIVEELGSITI